MHTFAADGYSVVWWDPQSLILGAKPSFGVRGGDLIVKDVPKDVVADGRSRYDRWRLARVDARAAGAVPSSRIATVHEWAAVPATTPSAETGDPDSVRKVEVRRSSDRSTIGGAAFGVLVHAVLATVPLGADRNEIDAHAARHGRLLSAPDDDVLAAAATVEGVLKHELLQRAKAADASGACRRESPVTLALSDGTMVEGFVDLAFPENGRWIVVDYKTDRELEANGEQRYRRQIALYAAAISRATGCPTDAILVRI
jgi:ATP-dependent exoDNAse (exonuclease V) beta subunit